MPIHKRNAVMATEYILENTKDMTYPVTRNLDTFSGHKTLTFEQFDRWSTIAIAVVEVVDSIDV